MLQRIKRVKQLKRVTTVFEIGMLTLLRNSPRARTGGGGGGGSLALVSRGKLLHVVIQKK